MGTVGLSFGSPTSGQGFDVTSTVSEIVSSLQSVETPWKNQLTALRSQDTALTSIGTDLSTLSSALQSLTDFEGVLSEKEGSSSDTSILQLTGASSSAVAGSHTIEVSSLAQTASWYSGDLSASDTLSGTLLVNGQKIAIVDGTTSDSSGNTIAANNTVSTLASSINSGDYGVTANVITDAGGERLSLVSSTSGKAGNFSVDSSGLTDATSGAGITFTQPQPGKDASFSVDGIPMTSSSNTVTSAIPGVTFQLLSSASDTPLQVEITNNNSDVESAVSSFVSAYNAVVADLNTQEGHDSSGNPEPLYGSPVLASLQEQLSLALNFTPSSGSITSLTQLGIETSSADDGTLTLNSGILQTALDSNYQGVVNFLQAGENYTSFGANFTSVLSSLSNTAPDGEVYLDLQSNASTETGLNNNVSNEESLISTEKTQLTTELNEANYTLQAIPSQLQEMNEMYSAITGYNQNTNG